MEPYFLIAFPMLSAGSTGEHCIEGVVFIAIQDTDLHRWRMNNARGLAIDLTSLVSAQIALYVMTRLNQGETVLFPNKFPLAQIKRWMKAKNCIDS
jgi:hypothetical protein